MLSYEDVLAKTKFESVGTSIRRRFLLFTGFRVRMDDSRLPERMLSGLLTDRANMKGERQKTN